MDNGVSGGDLIPPGCPLPEPAPTYGSAVVHATYLRRETSHDAFPAVNRLDAVVISPVEPCAPDCADCAFDTHVDSTWVYVRTAYARRYFADRRARVNPLRATPFVSDMHSREIFATIATLDVL